MNNVYICKLNRACKNGKCTRGTKAAKLSRRVLEIEQNLAKKSLCRENASF